MLRLNCWNALEPALSLTCPVNIAAISAVGVPLMTPEELSDSPGATMASVQLYGGVPPCAESDWL